MPVPSVPTKTSLGQDELRHRTQRLGQRHRTVLFLVDGRRTLAEVLSLAHQAGAQTVHFEELVRLGLVELPPDAAADEVEDSGSGALDPPTLTSVALDVTPEDAAQRVAVPARIIPVLLDEPPAVQHLDDTRLSSTSLLPPEPVVPAWQHAPVDEPIALEDVPVLAPRVEPAAPPVRLVEAAVPWSDTVPTAPDAVQPPAALPAAPPPPVPVPSPPVLLTAPPVSAGRSGKKSPRTSRTSSTTTTPSPAVAPSLQLVVPSTGAMTAVLNKARALGRSRARPPVEVPVAVPPVLRPATELQLIAQVRELLLDTLRIDAPVFAAITHGKVRGAQSQRDLIDVVWEIERHSSHARMSRNELISLQQARELLGMGNTIVAGDSHVDRDDDWPTTQPPQ